MGNVIKVRELTKRFGNFTAVDRISFNVKEGEIFGFLGANGAGKTTAIQMLCGISKPSGGTGTVAGFDINKESEKIKRNIGYMSQRFSLYEDLRVWENIRLFGGIYGLSEKVIAEKTDAGTKFTLLSEKPNIQEILEGAPLGDIWFSGILGGVPDEE